MILFTKNLILAYSTGKLYAISEKEWKERSSGDIKILYNPQTGKARVLVRQATMLYVRANHNVPDAELKIGFNSDKAWLWSALDFAQSNTGKMETFAVKFKDAESAKQFKSAWDQAREYNKRSVVQVVVM